MSRYLYMPLIYFLLFSSTVNAQTWKWALGSDCNKNSLAGIGIAADRKGHIYEISVVEGRNWYGSPLRDTTDTIVSVFGSYSVTAQRPDGLQALLVCVDSSGSYRWVLGTLGSDAQFTSVTTDTSGNVYVTGIADGNITFGGVPFLTPYGYFVAKVSPAGSVQWVKPTVDGFVILQQGCSDRVYVAGSFTKPTDAIGSTVLTNPGGGSAFIAALDTNGTPIWAVSISGAGGGAGPIALCVGIHDLYLAGWYTSPVMRIGSDTLVNSNTHSAGEIFIAKVTISGNVVWGRTFPRVYNNLYSINADNDDNVYFVGVFGDSALAFGPDTLKPRNNPPNGAFYTASFDSAGRARWAWEDTSNLYAFDPGLVSSTATSCNDVWVSAPVRASPFDSLALLRFDSYGHHLITVYIRESESYNGITADNANNLYVTSSVGMGDTIIAHDTLHNTDSTISSAFIARLHVCEEPLSENISIPRYTSPDILIYPNPTTGELFIHAGYTLYNSYHICGISGNTLLQGYLTSNTQMVPVAGLPPGMYLIILTAKDGYVVRKFVKM